MNSVLLWKAILGLVAGATVTTGTIYFGTDLFRGEQKIEKKTISTLLRDLNPDKRLLTSDIEASNQVWKDAWANYRNNNKESNPWGIKTWSKVTQSVQSGDNAPDDFVSKCVYQGNLRVSNGSDSLYENALKYCTRDTLVEDLVKESGRSLREKGDGKSSEWKALWTKYREANKNKGVGQDEWKISDNTWSSVTEEDAPEKFRNKCETESKLKESKFGSDSVQRVLSYCT
ncbi:hypothetical protein MHC_01275 [Mycoplasma haemocanis str. Illinois]|uniref:Uncharacterized protein n=1 Tax=Mycoplasma haemocanis (strain Illinois) TaxID=1111676 RepID=H6N649_MYCHN|nr:hypothetical protein [Mycoplasma haemocanis]AEW45121.1 hypothetical protein MHC_01275 [Mycoplasma haemocanis str. Illinois]